MASSSASADAVVKILGRGGAPSPRLPHIWAQVGPLVSNPAVTRLLSGKEIVHVFQAFAATALAAGNGSVRNLSATTSVASVLGRAQVADAHEGSGDDGALWFEQLRGILESEEGAAREVLEDPSLLGATRARTTQTLGQAQCSASDTSRTRSSAGADARGTSNTWRRKQNDNENEDEVEDSTCSPVAMQGQNYSLAKTATLEAYLDRQRASRRIPRPRSLAASNSVRTGWRHRLDMSAMLLRFRDEVEGLGSLAQVARLCRAWRILAERDCLQPVSVVAKILDNELPAMVMNNAPYLAVADLRAVFEIYYNLKGGEQVEKKASDAMEASGSTTSSSPFVFAFRFLDSDASPVLRQLCVRVRQTLQTATGADPADLVSLARSFAFLGESAGAQELLTSVNPFRSSPTTTWSAVIFALETHLLLQRLYFAQRRCVFQKRFCATSEEAQSFDGRRGRETAKRRKWIERYAELIPPPVFSRERLVRLRDRLFRASGSSETTSEDVIDFRQWVRVLFLVTKLDLPSQEGFDNILRSTSRRSRSCTSKYGDPFPSSTPTESYENLARVLVPEHSGIASCFRDLVIRDVRRVAQSPRICVFCLRWCGLALPERLQLLECCVARRASGIRVDELLALCRSTDALLTELVSALKLLNRHDDEVQNLGEENVKNDELDEGNVIGGIRPTEMAEGKSGSSQKAFAETEDEIDNDGHSDGGAAAIREQLSGRLRILVDEIAGVFAMRRDILSDPERALIEKTFLRKWLVESPFLRARNSQHDYEPFAEGNSVDSFCAAHNEGTPGAISMPFPTAQFDRVSHRTTVGS
ncbi:unnamed protein product [Amoebophrya sp. A25]|nr:unnamed protein product [Amoebophrya sp. A25]|eukprot:GSA25T00001777001.1